MRVASWNGILLDEVGSSTALESRIRFLLCGKRASL